MIDKINIFINQENFFTIDLEKLDFGKRTLEPFKQLVIQEQWTEILSAHEKSISYGIKFEIFLGKVILIKNTSFGND